MTDGVRPFRISVPDEALQDLRERLHRTLWPDEIEAAPWRYGPPVAYMMSLVRYWLDDYDWRAREAELNGLAHFVADVDGHDIHFIHEQGRGPAPLPLVMTTAKMLFSSCVNTRSCRCSSSVTGRPPSSPGTMQLQI